MSLYIASGFIGLRVEDLFKVGITTNLSVRLRSYKRLHPNVTFLATKSVIEDQIFSWKDAKDREQLKVIENKFIDCIQSSSDFQLYKGLYGKANEWFIGDVQKAVSILETFEPNTNVSFYLKEMLEQVSNELEKCLHIDEDYVDEFLGDIDEIIKDKDNDNDNNNKSNRIIEFKKICGVYDYRIVELKTIFDVYHITQFTPVHYVSCLFAIFNQLRKYAYDIDNRMMLYDSWYNMRFIINNDENAEDHLKSLMDENILDTFCDAIHTNVFELLKHIENGHSFNLSNKLQQMIMYTLLQEVIIHEPNPLTHLVDKLEDELIFMGDDCDDEFRFMQIIAYKYSKRFINHKLLNILVEKNDRNIKRNLLEWISYFEKEV